MTPDAQWEEARKTAKAVRLAWDKEAFGYSERTSPDRRLLDELIANAITNERASRDEALRVCVEALTQIKGDCFDVARLTELADAERRTWLAVGHIAGRALAHPAVARVRSKEDHNE